MSLKAFHILFIVSSILLSLGFGVWEIRVYRQGGTILDLGLGLFALAGAVTLGVYFKAMLRKLRSFSLL